VNLDDTSTLANDRRRQGSAYRKCFPSSDDGGPLWHTNIITHTWAVNSDFGESYSNAKAVYECTKSESAGANERLEILLFPNMQFILAKFFRQYESHDAWWYKVKSSPNSSKDSKSPTYDPPVNII
jgi:hypothetical protein